MDVPCGVSLIPDIPDTPDTMGRSLYPLMDIPCGVGGDTPLCSTYGRAVGCISGPVGSSTSHVACIHSTRYPLDNTLISRIRPLDPSDVVRSGVEYVMGVLQGFRVLLRGSLEHSISVYHTGGNTSDVESYQHPSGKDP